MGMETVHSHANFIIVKVDDGEGIFRELQKRGVITRQLGGYELPEWIRISIGTIEENEYCLKAIRELR
jgi:histidinol-phosphate aminotransferase